MSNLGCVPLLKIQTVLSAPKSIGLISLPKVYSFYFIRLINSMKSRVGLDCISCDLLDLSIF